LGPNHAALFEAREQFQNVCPNFCGIRPFVLQQQFVRNGGYSVFSIDAGENIPGGAGEL
jgi:hypothetical protein